MNTSDSMSSVFENPKKWGLRGDPCLWEELRDHFAHEGLPDTREEFVEQVESAIKSLVGSDLEGDESIFVERYHAGGMSSGHISPEWWRDVGIPLLRKQF